MSNKCLFILDHKLHDYRVPFFNRLVDKGVDLIVVHPGPVNKSFTFKRQYITSSILKIGPFKYLDYPDLNKFTKVVFMQNIRIINLWFFALNPFRKCDLITWGIGVSSSNGLSTHIDLPIILRKIISLFCTYIIFYSDYPLKYYREFQDKIYVANNTIYNSLMYDTSSFTKKHFTFIGKLDKRKGLPILLDAFHTYINDKRANSAITKLVIVGDGEMKSFIINYINNNNLNNNIYLAGSIYDAKSKFNIFKDTLVTISPFQAGLSVLESFSFGVPFICFENPISGGEHLNIKNDKTGYFVNSKSDLIEKMILLSRNKKKAISLGHNSFNHYKNNRQISGMVRVFENLLRK